MPQPQFPRNFRAPNPAVLPEMHVTPANSRGAHVDEDFSLLWSGSRDGGEGEGVRGGGGYGEVGFEVGHGFLEGVRFWLVWVGRVWDAFLLVVSVSR